MSGFKEISNLGIEASKSYAANASINDLDMLKNAPLISQQTQQDVNQPILHLSSDALFNLDQRNRSFAHFQEPPAASPLLFTNGLIRSLSSERLETINLTLDNLNQSASSQPDEQKIECQKLSICFRKITNRHRDFLKIYNERYRTQKA